ncbi:radical SAM family heme chaperone HemW [Frateuria aurantia]
MRAEPNIMPPLALYIHMPWCVRKCPYCDFNSHGLKGVPAYAEYIDALLADLAADLADFGLDLQPRPVTSIFFGGGTPSLFSAELIDRLLSGVRQRLPLAADAEITLETNPGTVEHGRFEGYRQAGINRISFGIQSFNDDRLRRLGRIHSADEARLAFASARAAGFDNINLDLMYALPEQDLEGALADIDAALVLAPEHLSHYQLTLEPNTAFAAQPPPLPDDDEAWAMQEACQQRLADAGYRQYEVSAYARDGARCRHNLNYWSFGDYLGIGAGAHGKISEPRSDGLRRRSKQRLPKAYLADAGGPGRLSTDTRIAPADRVFEYMLNSLRLIDGTPMAQFSERTGLPLEHIAAALAAARQRGWLVPDPGRLQTTPLGQRFLNDVITHFMD